MPSKSKLQADLMRAVAHSLRFAKKVGIPQSVGREFNEADKLRQTATNGDKLRQTIKKNIKKIRNKNT